MNGVSHPWWSALLLVALCCVVGCGGERKGANRTEGLPDEPRGALPKARERASEMVPLSPKRIVREAQERGWREGFAMQEVEGSAVEVEAVALPEVTPGRGWETETLSREALEQLDALFESGPESGVLVASDFEGTLLWPEDFAADFALGETRVRRWSGPSAATQVKGAQAFSEEVASLKQHFGEGLRIEWKPVGIAQDEEIAGALETSVKVEMSGYLREENHRAEAHATWRCRWRKGVDQDALTLQGIEVGTLEVVSSASEAWFQDVSASALAAVPQARDQILTGIEYWAQRITRYGDLHLMGHHGLAVGDVNGDGLEDLYVCDGGSLPNRLYVQQADGTVIESAAEAGVDFLEDSRGALLIDLDNDGDQDLVVATIAMIAVAENDGRGRFTLRGGHGGARYPSSLSAADPDGDGDLDVYVCVYEGERASGSRGFEARMPVPFHDAQNGGRNVLLENLGDLQFAEGTERMGLDRENSRWSLAAAWEDYDRDGDPDLYVANDFGRNQLFLNEGGRFVDVAAELGVEDMAAGMSVAWGDVNRDGRADLYVGNMYSSAGHRIAYQRAFQGGSAGALEGKRRMARGNTLFEGGELEGGRSTGDDREIEDGKGFEDVSESAGVTMGRWAWSSAMADLNNDGWDDLLVANGFITNRREDDL